MKPHALRNADRNTEHGRQRLGICSGSDRDLIVLGQHEDGSLTDSQGIDITRSSSHDRRSVETHNSVELADSRTDTSSEDVPLAYRTWYGIRPRRDSEWTRNRY